MRLVNQWNRDREQDSDGVPTAAEVTRTIWNAEETIGANVSNNANSLTIADVLEVQAKEFFGGQRWDEMEEYINRLTPAERDEINLPEFTGIFYNVLRDFGTPDAGPDEKI
jgi:hypothetical protein